VVSSSEDATRKPGAVLALTLCEITGAWGSPMSIKNKLIFGFSTIGLLFLTVIIGNAIWYHISNVALRLAATTLLLLVLVSIIQVLYLMLIHRYEANI